MFTIGIFLLVVSFFALIYLGVQVLSFHALETYYDDYIIEDEDNFEIKE